MSKRVCLEHLFEKTQPNLQEPVAEVDNLTRVQSITSLPVDLKLEIFLHAHHNVTPLVLGAVCKEWRDIVWNFPRLWDTINLVLSQHHYETQILLLKDWLERSGKCPLSISLHHPTVGFPPTTYRDPEPPCLSLLFEHSYRWEHINFNLGRKDIINMIRQPGHLPFLRSLTIYFDLPDTDFNLASGPGLHYFAKAPLLGSANVNGYELADIVLPWNQLEHLRFRFRNDQQLCETLEHAQNLVHCQLQSATPRPYTPNPRVQLPNLQSIIVGDHRMLEMIDLPGLKHLRIGWPYGTLDLGILLDFVGRSFCHITTLDASALRLIGGFMSLLRGIPSLLNLRLDLEESEDELPHVFVKQLHPDCETPFLPNLEALTYTGWTRFHYTTLMDVLEQRWKKGVFLRSERDKGHQLGWLKSVHIGSTNAIPGMCDTAMNDKLEMLRREGMDIVISAGENMRSRTSHHYNRY